MNNQRQDFDKDCSVFLLGMMGSGKTSLGKKLAKKIGYEFLDLDRYIIDKTGASINLIFEFEGEQGFRKRETDALKKVINYKKTIIATGGGVISEAENRSLLKNQYCIYLNSSIERILKKTRFSKKRPLLNDLNDSEKKEFLQNLIVKREKYYLSLANHSVSAYGNGIAVINKIHQLIRQDLDLDLN